VAGLHAAADAEEEVAPPRLVAGTEGTKIKVATGDYNDALQARIDAIRAKCGEHLAG